jgi:hypothetical protein
LTFHDKIRASTGNNIDSAARIWTSKRRRDDCTLDRARTSDEVDLGGKELRGVIFESEMAKQKK